MRRSVRSTFLLVATLLASGCSYNSLQDLKNQVEKGEADIRVQLQRRADLIDNLVQTVKAMTKQESTVFVGIAEARSKLAGTAQTGSLKDLGEANAALAQPLSRLLALTESYPELRSSENFKMLQDQLEGTENRVAVARQDYNAAVQKYNAAISRFPANLTAKMFGLGTPKEYFQLDSPDAKKAPKVDFQK